MILGKNGEKMSKSRGNVINPDDIVKKYGADALRLYEMFMGPLEGVSKWEDSDLNGAKHFIDRVWNIFVNNKNKWSNDNNGELDYIYNFTVKKVSEDFANLHFNTAVSQMMIFINSVYNAKKIYKEYMVNFLKMFSCICPFISEELYCFLGYKNSIYFEKWPVFDEKKIILNKTKIALSINGKLKSVIEVKKDLNDDDLKKIALNDNNIKRNINNKTIKKIIIVKNKIINFVL